MTAQSTDSRQKSPMAWVQVGSRHLSPPYQCVNGVRGWEAWEKTDKRYSVIKREILTIDQAKAVCELHSLEAEFVK